MPNAAMNETKRILSEATRRLTLAEAARVIGVDIGPAAVWRMARKGTLALDGTRVRLRHERIGRKIFTRPEWIEDYMAELNRADLLHFDGIGQPCQQNLVPAQLEIARAELATMGFKSDAKPTAECAAPKISKREKPRR
jgi:hypothetical protein